MLPHFFWNCSLVCFFLFLHVIPDGLDNGEIRSLYGAPAVVRLLVHTKISMDYKNEWQKEYLEM